MNGMTPFINKQDGAIGFFEYELYYRDINIHARTLEELQSLLDIEVFHRNNDKVYQYLNSIVTDEYNKLSDEEKSKIRPNTFHNSFINNPTDEVKQKLLDEGILYPPNLTINDCEVINHTPSEVGINELKDIIKNVPDISQPELESIYHLHRSNNSQVNELFLQSQLANLSLNTSESMLDMTEMMCEMYESQETMKEQLLNDAELITTLYEANNKEESE